MYPTSLWHQLRLLSLHNICLLNGGLPIQKVSINGTKVKRQTLIKIQTSHMGMIPQLITASGKGPNLSMLPESAYIFCGTKPRLKVGEFFVEFPLPRKLQ